ncbi:MAG: biotin-dependent carboxyltransferase family protein [Chloroflexi bacterium]|nr:MAG: biotin-dependent carboxyltransferase family protein [Chloroflexota bacterium]
MDIAGDAGWFVAQSGSHRSGTTKLCRRPRWPGCGISAREPFSLCLRRDAFPADALTRLEATACLITPAVDRMGLRIATPGLHLRGDEILTTPMTAGALQVTPSGQLIALLVDHPTTGGYPVIATVITADIPLLAQARPGETIRFRQVDRPTAASALRRLTDWLDDL